MNVLQEMLQGMPPAPIPVAEVRMGPFLTAVRLAGSRGGSLHRVARCGLASTMAGHDPGGGHRIRGVGGLQGRKAQDLAQYLLSEIPAEASVGMATLNAILDVPEHCHQGVPFLDLILERARGKSVAVVGHFPFVDGLRKVAEDLRVLELKPSRGDLPASRAEEILPRCEVVVLTATVLMNGTYQEVIPLCSEPFTVMVGPSTPSSPVLFQHGVDALAGSLVVDPEGTLTGVSQGATYRDLEGIRKWTWVREW